MLAVKVSKNHYRFLIAALSCVFLQLVFVSAFSHAQPVIITEPLLEDSTPLSTDPDYPTIFPWRQQVETAWEWSDNSTCPETLEFTWFVQDADNQTVCRTPLRYAEWVYCAPGEYLEQGLYEFWAEISDCEGTAVTNRYYIYLEMPAIARLSYKDAREEFLGKLARDGRTAFKNSPEPNNILDSPEVWGCDNPSMFYGNGRLHFIFGDPNIYIAPSTSYFLNGALAFTDTVVPEKGLSIDHRRNWLCDNATGTVKSIIAKAPGSVRTNCTGGAVVPSGEGSRLWFVYYDYGAGDSDIPSYRDYHRIGIAYSDDGLKTSAVREDGLILWEKANGGILPDPFLGYSMRLFKDHLYMMIPRVGRTPVLLRCRTNELDCCSLDDWQYLISTDANGTAQWSKDGISRGQISQEGMPGVDFGEWYPEIVNSVIWNPYMNRWIAVNAFSDFSLSIWASKYFWGPYTNIQYPGMFPIRQLASSYNFFMHESLLGSNGESIYYARSRTWHEVSQYGTYLQRIRLQESIGLELSQKCAAAGDTLTVTCINKSGFPPPAPENVTVTVDGIDAAFDHQDADRYIYTYTLSGTENSGMPGSVDIAATIDIINDTGTTFRFTRSVALVVHYSNNLYCYITTPANRDEVSGVVFLEVDAGYAATPVDLGPGHPEVRIMKVELQHADNGLVQVDDADLEAPYRLKLDTTRFENGQNTFQVVAYDTLDRRCVSEITLFIDNQPQPPVPGNTVLDGTMEAAGTAAWASYNGCLISKTGGPLHRSGKRSLLLRSSTPGSSAGVEQTVGPFSGNETLRFSAWTRLKAGVNAQLVWSLINGQGVVLKQQECSSYGYFRRCLIEFNNPYGNTEITLRCTIRDAGNESSVAGLAYEYIEGIIDDVVLRQSTYPIVEPPSGTALSPDWEDNSVTLSWDQSGDVNREFCYIYRKDPEDRYTKIAEVPHYITYYTDTDPPAAPGELVYKITAVDEMAWESDGAIVYFIDTDNDTIPDDTDSCPDVCNIEQRDADGDGIGDVCDPEPGCGGCGQPVCEYSCSTDTDGDAILDYFDNCPMHANPGQEDTDDDGAGDACDNCRGVSNADQCDTDRNCPEPPYTSNPLCGDACFSEPVLSSTSTTSTAAVAGGGRGGKSSTTTTSVPVQPPPLPLSTTTSPSTTTTVTVQPPPLPLPECSVDADCDDDLFCNGAERCYQGKCIHADNPCESPCICNEDLDTCWDVKRISAVCSADAITRPLLFNKKFKILVLTCASHSLFNSSSQVSIIGPNESAHGIQKSRFVPQFKLGMSVFIPIVIARDCTTGQWLLSIKTAGDRTNPYDEYIEAWFSVK